MRQHLTTLTSIQEISAMIYLYVKTHLDTGLKYFGKTTKPNYEKYRGSGKYWKRHIQKYGYNVKTELIFSHSDPEIVKQYALQFSERHDIVESKEWANLIPETGLDGGSLSEYHTPETRLKMSRNRRGKVGTPAGWKHDDETKEHLSKKAKERCERLGPPKGAFKKGNVPVNKGVPMTDEQKKLLSESLKSQKKIACPHCNKSVTAGNYARWHGDNCKEKTHD